MSAGDAAPFVAARDFLIRHRTDYATAYRDFAWPKLDRFNWALDYFDVMARGNEQPALWLVDEDTAEIKLSFAQLSERSNRVANAFRRLGVKRLADHRLGLAAAVAELEKHRKRLVGEIGNCNRRRRWSVADEQELCDLAL